MITLIAPQDNRTLQASFLMVRKRNNKLFNVGQQYQFIDYADNILGVFYLVDIKNFMLHNIPLEVSYLDDNYTPEQYRYKLENTFKIKSTDEMSQLIFSISSPVNSLKVDYEKL